MNRQHRCSHIVLRGRSGYHPAHAVRDTPSETVRRGDRRRFPGHHRRNFRTIPVAHRVVSPAFTSITSFVDGLRLVRSGQRPTTPTWESFRPDARTARQRGFPTLATPIGSPLAQSLSLTPPVAPGGLHNTRTSAEEWSFSLTKECLERETQDQPRSTRDLPRRHSNCVIRKRQKHIALPAHAHSLGMLRFDAQGACENAAFEYDAGLLAATDGFAIDPSLPLVAGSQFHHKERDGCVFHGASCGHLSRTAGRATSSCASAPSAAGGKTRRRGCREPSPERPRLPSGGRRCEPCRRGARFPDEDGVFQCTA